MKIFKILSHPYMLVLSFLFIIISGEHLGGFYVLYLLLGLYHGILHSVLGFLGVLVLVTNYHSFMQNASVKRTLNILGVSFLFFSLYYFFERDTEHYNWGTFHLVLPLFTLIFTSFIALCFLIGTFWQPTSRGEPRQGFLSKV